MEDAKKLPKSKPIAKEVVVDKELKAQNELLQEQLRVMQEQMQQLMTMQKDSKPTQEVNTSMDRWVDIIHLAECPTKGTSSHIEIPSRTIDFYKYGETRSIRYNEFQELVGKYRSWFEKNIIAVGEKDKDLAIKEGLPTEVDITLTKRNVESLVNMSADEIKELYEKLSDGHKVFITRMWANGYWEIGGAYRDITKVQMLNQLSGGEMNNILKDLLAN